MKPSASILWQRLDLPGHEAARLDALDAGWSLAGTAVFAFDQAPCKLDYRIHCDAAWLTTSAQVQGYVGDREVTLHVAVEEGRRWRLNGADCPSVAGCLDLDLGFSPATNLLPIRRLQLGVGASAEVRAAWLPFPALAFELLPQVYRREGETAYRYESRGGAFVRTLEVNAAGFVTSYPGLWRAETGA